MVLSLNKDNYCEIKKTDGFANTSPEPLCSNESSLIVAFLDIKN
jgi:hypothetical protein